MIKEFFKYRKQWLEETAMSSVGGPHPTLQHIIDMGEDVLPLIFFDLSHTLTHKNPIHWFYALHEITGQSPVHDDHLGDIINMALDWLEWATFNGYSDCIDLKP